ncbi:MAG TPA: type II toxin-antitoxin system ParD family antitoxin [Phycisphaerales bacterium]|nr:type II toxin-antitoxin system ParD family antitoxin [Phycisphaerales bacterium]
MNVSLTKQLEKYVRDRVKSGEFGNASEVIRDALRRVAGNAQWEADLRELVEEGLEDERAGRTVTYQKGDREKFKRDVRKAQAAKPRRSTRGAA